MYKIIFFDLDGTLLNEQKEILEESKKAIEKAKEKGIEIVLCSGRQKNRVTLYAEHLKEVRYIISSNGAYIYDYKKNEDLFTCEIDKELSLNLCEFAVENDYLLRIDTPYARYINKTEYSYNNEVELNETIDELIKKDKILQLTIGVESEEKVDKIIESLKNNPYIKIENKYPLIINNQRFWLINIINSSSSKGNGIYGLCKYLKIDVKDAIAFGDDLNDASMMKTVGMGVAMENAHSEVKKLAKKVIGNNEEPSIANFIYEIIE